MDFSVPETRYRRLFETAKDGILILDVETGMIIDVNPFLIQLLGYSKNKFMEKAVWEIGFFKDIIENREKFMELQDKGYVRYENLPLETSDGHMIDVEFVSNVYSEGSKNVIQCNIRDISKRIKTENELIRTNKFLDSIIENIPDMIFIKESNNLNFVMVNCAGENLMGISRDELLGRNDFDFFPKEQAEMFVNADKKVLREKKMIDIPEELIQTKNQGIRILHTKKVPIMNNEGEPKFLLGISEDITVRKQKEDELKIAKEKAEESNRLKSAFLANMSHEIRTPMNGILGFAGLLKEPGLSGDEQDKYIEIIEKSGARMLNIINDIISISKIESGLMEISVFETNINEQVKFLYEFFKQEAENKGIKIFLTCTLPVHECIIRTDREKIFGIMTNLVKNAIKFTQDGFIEIGCEKAGNDVLFHIKDTGVGIDPKKQKTIFERFRQGSESLSRNYEGAGLGLSISKAYVEMLGGKIWVKSKPGEGSVFYFTIPINHFPLTKSVFSNSILTEEYENRMEKLNILIAEDDETSEILIRLAIQLYCKKIISARTGHEAVETCRQNPDIDLILMDIKMPDMDGLEATRRIRKFNKEVIIVAQTAFGLAGDREIAINAGCDEYIAKPFNKVSLMILIKNIMMKRKRK